MSISTVMSRLEKIGANNIVKDGNTIKYTTKDGLLKTLFFDNTGEKVTNWTSFNPKKNIFTNRAYNPIKTDKSRGNTFTSRITKTDVIKNTVLSDRRLNMDKSLDLDKGKGTATWEIRDLQTNINKIIKDGITTRNDIFKVKSTSSFNIHKDNVKVIQTKEVFENGVIHVNRTKSTLPHNDASKILENKDVYYNNEGDKIENYDKRNNMIKIIFNFFKM